MTIFSNDTERLLASLPEASPTMQHLLQELGGAFPEAVKEGNARVIHLPGPAEQKEPAQE